MTTLTMDTEDYQDTFTQSGSMEFLDFDLDEWMNVSMGSLY